MDAHSISVRPLVPLADLAGNRDLAPAYRGWLVRSVGAKEIAFDLQLHARRQINVSSGSVAVAIE